MNCLCPREREKAARKKLEFKPAYVNHEVEVSNNIGLTGQAVFTDTFTSNDGIIVPAGLDAPIWIVQCRDESERWRWMTTMMS